MYKWVKSFLFDDLVLWCSEEHATTATYRMQQAADQLSAWAEEWYVQVNTDKSCTTLFTLSPKRVITGAMKSTPIKAMEHLTTIPPLNHRRDAKALVQAAKYEFLPDHPMAQKLQGLTKNRLRR